MDHLACFRCKVSKTSTKNVKGFRTQHYDNVDLIFVVLTIISISYDNIQYKSFLRSRNSGDITKKDVGFWCALVVFTKIRMHL